MGAYLDKIKSLADSGDQNAVRSLKRIEDRAKEVRPSYQSAATGEAVQIDEDTEAFLILLDADVKTGIIGWISTLLRTATNTDLLEMMGEVIDARLTSFQQNQGDLGPLISEYESYRQGLTPKITYKDETDPRRVREDVVPISQVSSLLRSMRNMFGPSIPLEQSEMHHRILDFLALDSMNNLQNSGESAELDSWKGVLSQYIA